MKRVVFTGGGTGGHVYPALAVHQALPEPVRRSVHWIGSRSGIEGDIVRSSGIPFHGIPAGKLRRYLDIQNFLDIFRVVAGILAARRVLKCLGAGIVFSKGGFVAVPVVVAARTLGIPVVIHESDSDPGLATRLTAPLAARICLPYGDMQGSFPGMVRRRIVVTGNPVRQEFFHPSLVDALAAVGLRDSRAPVVLVTGGSLGAQQLNEFVRDHIVALTEYCVVVHQTGRATPEIIRETERIVTDAARQERYVAAPAWGEEYAPLLHRADLVVCRAGAGTIWELAVTGTPAVLVPLNAGASRGDQIRNARRYARNGAALVVDIPAGASSDVLADHVFQLVQDTGRRETMSVAARRFAGSDAAAAIAGVITGLYNSTG